MKDNIVHLKKYDKDMKMEEKEFIFEGETFSYLTYMFDGLYLNLFRKKEREDVCYE